MSDCMTASFAFARGGSMAWIETQQFSIVSGVR